MLLLAVVAVAPGVSIVAGLLLMIPAFQMIAGHPAPIFPRRVAAHPLPTRHLAALVRRAVPVLRYLEKMIHPRWPTPIDATKRLVAFKKKMTTVMPDQGSRHKLELARFAAYFASPDGHSGRRKGDGHRYAVLRSTVLPTEPGDVYGDSAFAGRNCEQLILARGGIPFTVQTATWGGQAALDRLKAHNAKVRHIRCRIEKVFGTTKRSYGLRRMRWLGLAKAGLQVRLTAIAYNMRRSFRLVSTASV